jgi:polyhydroxyalkanoate synthase subunit PhaC
MPALDHPLVLLGAALSVFAALAFLHYRHWVRKLGLPMEYERVDRIETPDGSAIEMRRIARPRTCDRPPVLLVHGLGANHRNLDAEPDRSLARVLAAAGRDVWLVTLRSGRSDRRLREWNKVKFGLMARYDLPLAVEHVRRETRAERLDLVGFSMGGMLLYAALGRGVPCEHIRRVAIVGSPGIVWPPLRWLRRFPLATRVFAPGLPLRFLARMFAFATDWLPKWLGRAIYNPDNCAPGSARWAMVNLIEDVPSTQATDFTRWALHTGDVVLEGERILDALARVPCPALFIAGAADRLAPPHTVRAAFEMWGEESGAPKKLVVLSKQNGFPHDYGHGDLAIGRDVVRDVFVPVRDFLAAG